MQIIPSCYRTVGNMRDMTKLGDVQAYCSRCRQYRVVDPAITADAKGDDYSLVDRTTRCTATEGCTGRMNFHVLLGVLRPLRVSEGKRRR